MQIGETKLAPDWGTVLAYEYACRKKIFQNCREEGSSVAEELLSVVKDSEIKELHFTTPLVLGNRGDGKRKWGKDAAPVADPAWKKNKGGKDGKGGKDSTKGSGKDGKGGKEGKGGKLDKKEQWLWRTQDGRDICFIYNSDKPCDGACGRLHICRVKGCGKEHPAVRHRALTAP